MEQGVGTICFATGMGAIGAVVQALLRAGDHVVSSSFLFGNTNSLWQTAMSQGIGVSFVDATDVANVEAAITENTRVVFVETIANPRTQVADLKRIGELCKARGILYVVDNTMTTPYLFQPKSVHAGLVVNALTKSIGGHGNGRQPDRYRRYDWTRFPNIYENYKKAAPLQWGLAQIRARHCVTSVPRWRRTPRTILRSAPKRWPCACSAPPPTLALAEMLEKDERVAAVYYPGLKSHPQHGISAELFRAHGSLLSFELKDGLDCFDFLNRLKLAIPASNLATTAR
jgi:O-acetylhomoserine (thiol)-lyase